MLLKKRLIPIVDNEKTIGLITFYIGNGDTNKYVRDDPWSILDDEPNDGTVCYIDQCITNKEASNHNFSWRVWRHINDYIRQTYPRVRVIRWNRLKGGIPHVYYHRIT